MKNLLVLVGACLVVHLCCNNVQAHPHRSIEDTEEDMSSESESASSPVVVGHAVAAPERDSSHVREMTSHESKSHEDDDSSEEDRDDNKSDEDDTVKFPKTESLCPARPEEITNIEMECAREYQLWKELRAKKDITTTSEPVQEVLVESAHPHHPHHPHTHHNMNSSTEAMSEDMQMSTSTQEMTTEDEMTTPDEMTTQEETATTTEEEETTTTEMTTTTRLPPTTTTTVPMRRSNNNSGRKHKRSIRRKRSCYPATCILKKLNLLDSMGQPSIKQIQKFAVNMTVDDSMNLEEKAMECVKEINEAMIDASSDIGKKVGCVAQKVITCLNKGLTCPIMKVPQ